MKVAAFYPYKYMGFHDPQKNSGFFVGEPQLTTLPSGLCNSSTLHVETKDTGDLSDNIT